MRIYLSPQKKEAIAMLLRREIDSGWGGSYKRALLYKIQRSKRDLVRLTADEITELTSFLVTELDAVSDCPDQTPSEGPYSRRYHYGGTPYHRSYPTEGRIRMIEKELSEGLED